MKDTENICEVKFCRDDSIIGYYEHSVCNKHWKLHCDDSNEFDLKKEFDIICN